jgi:hypothetical protein
MFHQLWRKRAVALGLCTSAATATIVAGLPHVAYADPLTGSIALTSPTTGKLAAGLAKQVLLLTVTGQPLSEAFVTGVQLGGDSNCANIISYIVTSPTTLAVKTPDNGCAATDTGQNANGEDIVIKFAGGNTLTRTASASTKGVFFVAPPAIAASNAVITENSSELTTPIKQFVSNGGQLVRVASGASFAFDPRGVAGLAVSFGGKPGTDVKVYAADGTPIASSVSQAPSASNYLTFKSATGMSTADPSLTITQNGVAKTFTTTDTGATIVASPTVTSLSVTSGKVKTAVSTVITGTGFSKVLGDYTTAWTVNFCGKAGTVTAVDTSGGTKITVTTPTDVADDPAGLGTGKFSGSCAVTVTNGSGQSPITSPVSPGSYFQFLSE